MSRTPYTMATLALVKFKVDGRVEVVAVKDILSVLKKNGHKSFVPYEPANLTDFIVSKNFKYVVHVTDHEWNVRRWYVMVGRLGGSIEEVLDCSKGPVVWPERRRSVVHPIVEEKQLSDCGLTEFSEDPMDIDKDIQKDEQDITNSEKVFMLLLRGPPFSQEETRGISICDILEALHGRIKYEEKESLTMESVVDIVAKSFTAFTDCRERILNLMENHILPSLIVVQKRLDKLEKVAKRDAQVQQWLNTLPAVIPENLAGNCESDHGIMLQEGMDGLTESVPKVYEETNAQSKTGVGMEDHPYLPSKDQDPSDEEEEAPEALIGRCMEIQPENFSELKCAVAKPQLQSKIC